MTSSTESYRRVPSSVIDLGILERVECKLLSQDVKPCSTRKPLPNVAIMPRSKPSRWRWWLNSPAAPTAYSIFFIRVSFSCENSRKGKHRRRVKNVKDCATDDASKRRRLQWKYIDT